MSVIGLITFIAFSVAMILRTTRNIMLSYRYNEPVQKEDVVILICKAIAIALAVYLAFWLKETRGIMLFAPIYAFIYSVATIISMFLLWRLGYEVGFIFSLSAYWFESLFMETIFLIFWFVVGVFLLCEILH